MKTTNEQHADRLALMVRCLSIPLSEDVAAMEAGIAALRRVTDDTGHGDTLPRPNSPDKHTMGLYGKFKVWRTDGKDSEGEKHDGCDYFVLDITHDPHTIAALTAYAASCEADYPLLARDLRAKVALASPATTETPPNNMERAIWLCRALKAYPMPRIEPEGDGAIGLDWDEGASRVLTITIDDQQWIGYSYLVGEYKSCGRVAQIAAVSMIQEVLRLIYPEKSSGVDRRGRGRQAHYPFLG